MNLKSLKTALDLAHIGPLTPSEIVKLEADIAALEKGLQSGHMRGMDRQFRKMKSESSKVKNDARRALGIPIVNPPENWYTLFHGPVNAIALAEHLGRKDDYLVFYRHYSNTVHGADAVRSFSVSPTGKNLFERLRQPTGIQQAASTCVSMTRRACNDIVTTYLSKERNEEFKGANLQLMPLFQKLSHTVMVNWIDSSS